ncbi:DUF833-domain-containing protein [Laetiporus sulphureus 93-53]|uniref:DUF833-domain-containing protein n=1 Tax=Laetiporus sulphureus 93-53 TaxID=1314785 RepID=A0A165FM31_9APHY|nr:DUF833-domain-containing protein [Laetiporus sulphureus 93-53]KZT09177.1 DUF833-domain-containing protein [Laetiporus sulphureus 93-53]
MCVGFWSLEHPRYALILCSNRDEYLSRPTVSARFHSFGNINDDASGDGLVLSGRDMLAGGTWAGLSRSGRVAIITNITEPPSQYDSSRGDLTSSFLLPKKPTMTLREEIHELTSRNTKFAGFNLLLLSPRAESDPRANKLSLDAAIATNCGGGGRIIARELTYEERRCGGISNGVDHHGANEWPKVKHGVQALQDILSSDFDESKLVEQLVCPQNALIFGGSRESWKSDVAPIDRSTLRNTIEVDPLLIPIKSSSSDINDCYGTRLSTIILIRRDGGVLFIERDIWVLKEGGTVAKADPRTQREFRFNTQIDSEGQQVI